MLEIVLGSSVKILNSTFGHEVFKTLDYFCFYWKGLTETNDEIMSGHDERLSRICPSHWQMAFCVEYWILSLVSHNDIWKDFLCKCYHLFTSSFFMGLVTYWAILKDTCVNNSCEELVASILKSYNFHVIKSHLFLWYQYRFAMNRHRLFIPLMQMRRKLYLLGFLTTSEANL